MSKLLTIDAWLEETFAESSRPSKKTIYRWIKKRPEIARKIGGKLYIVVSNDSTTNVTQRNSAIDRIAAKM